MVKPDYFAGVGVNARDIRSFPFVATQASEGKIVEGGQAAVLFCDDVIDLERKTSARLWKSTILTQSFGPPPNFALEGSIHVESGDFVLECAARFGLHDGKKIADPKVVL